MVVSTVPLNKKITPLIRRLLSRSHTFSQRERHATRVRVTPSTFLTKIRESCYVDDVATIERAFTEGSRVR